MNDCGTDRDFWAAKRTQDRWQDSIQTTIVANRNDQTNRQLTAILNAATPPIVSEMVCCFHRLGEISLDYAPFHSLCRVCAAVIRVAACRCTQFSSDCNDRKLALHVEHHSAEQQTAAAAEARNVTQRAKYSIWRQLAFLPSPRTTNSPLVAQVACGRWWC